MTQDTETDYEAIEREKQMFRDLSQALSKPVTYYAQSEAIDSLIEKYGSSFQALTRAQKLQFIRLIVETLSGNDIRLTNAIHHHTEFLEDCLQLIAISSGRDLPGLMLALAAQLHDKVYAEDKP